MNEHLEVGGLKFEVRRSPRRRTLGLTVDRGGELVLHCPEAAGVEELAQWAHTKLLWVYRKLAIKEELAPKTREPEFVSGETFWYLGHSHCLKIVACQDEPLQFDGRRFSLRRDARPSGADHFRDWYSAVGKEWLAARIGWMAPRVGTAPSRVEVRDLGFRWGSCGKHAVVYFNWRLLQLSVRLVDYVVAHELVHLLEPHHGPEFWQVLDRSLPDWRQRRDELRIKAREVYWCSTKMED
jgi:predicted metal-dependent hydrolase